MRHKDCNIVLLQKKTNGHGFFGGFEKVLEGTPSCADSPGRVKPLYANDSHPQIPAHRAPDGDISQFVPDATTQVMPSPSFGVTVNVQEPLGPR